MPWPYHFVDLTEQQKHDRRLLIDRYGIYSQLSGLIPIIGYQLYRLVLWVYAERQRTKVDYTAVPSSPDRKKARKSSLGKVKARWRNVKWWLSTEVLEGWGFGSKGKWIAAATWLGWLLFLSVHRTGDDYLHITKRIAEVAVAQFPIHYMLTMKSRYSPLALAFNTSHEKLILWHQFLAKVIYTLLVGHVCLYLNFFYQNGILEKRLQELDVILGVNSMIYLTIMVTTSLQLIRNWSYRLFFTLHLIIGVSINFLLFFHAHHLRIYVVEALILFLIDLVLRKVDTTTGFATITAIANTKLVKVKVPVPADKLHRFHAAPGQHVYVSIPRISKPPGTSHLSIHDLLYNPFTVAEVSDSDITLILRALTGPTTKALLALTKLPKAKPPISIEGPIGVSQHFPNLVANYDRILLVAGGVGATFILPIYKSLLAQLETESQSADRVRMIWSMRSAAEANWVVSTPESKAAVEDDENIEIFITRSNANAENRSREAVPLDGSVELDELLPEQENVTVNGARERPDLKAIVNEVFRRAEGEKVAVLVCGPGGMATELRKQVGRWVEKGREVWFHDEGFGW